MKQKTEQFEKYLHKMTSLEVNCAQGKRYCPVLVSKEKIGKMFTTFVIKLHIYSMSLDRDKLYLHRKHVMMNSGFLAFQSAISGN